jgi:two-component system, OmpR family, response regulator
MPPELPPIKILVVDDDRAILDMMQTLLEKDGYHVKLLSDPTLVEDELKAGGYHLLILDLMMPKMDGIEALKRVRKIDNDIAVIIYTGYPNVETAVDAMKLEAVDYIRKPLENNDIFREVIERVLRKKGLARTPEEQLHRAIEANGAAYWPLRVAAFANRTGRILRIHFVALQDRNRARNAHSRAIRRILAFTSISSEG